MKKWCINKNNEIRYVSTYVRENISYDYHTTHLVVTMNNSYDSPCLKGCKLEEVDIKDFFETEKDCKIEILIRERFNNKTK